VTKFALPHLRASRGNIVFTGSEAEPRAFAGELLRDCFADPGAGSGNDRNLVL
jgi:hypothetical protein